MYLLDTNVVSELRRASRADPRVLAWAHGVPTAALFISVITLLELEKGVLLAERRDPIQGAMLRAWLSGQVEPSFADRTLVIDAATAKRCAALHVPNPRPDRDSLIAATALEHGFAVVTRNVADFAGTGVAVLDPWLS
ncbi:putative ribonuclease FitB (plasmid) [Variovorax sp. SRS16]|uniref:type II toxin-antitoxin system VapC family toxin n=1 Tax=Variovorax sp. SRS16 TaxID=282217 RepID=UPI001319973F|nr:type II toxin-antitoxin system VapC family toxin [Variovorax sp. SRS16]VTU45589.1 putative ribonuclease FitB [Variovorax sp. SRS16]